MADNLRYALERERRRGQVFAFAHNSHLQRGLARWQLGPHALAWWPAGSHLDAVMGRRYRVIAGALGSSQKHGISAPEARSLEARLTAGTDDGRLMSTAPLRALPPPVVAELPVRSGTTGYFPLTPQSFDDFDWLLALKSVA